MTGALEPAATVLDFLQFAVLFVALCGTLALAGLAAEVAAWKRWRDSRRRPLDHNSPRLIHEGRIERAQDRLRRREEPAA